MLAFSYVPSCVSRSLVPTLSSPSLFVSAAFFAQSVAAVQASHRGTRLNFPSTFLPLFLPLISPHLSSSSLSPLLSSFFFSPSSSPSTHQPPPTPIHPSIPPLPHASVSPPPDGCLCSSETAKYPPRRHYIHKAHRRPKKKENMAPACCVSHLEKSHSNSVRLENLNQTLTVCNYFPSPTPIFLLSLTPPLSLPCIPLAVF